MKHYPYMEVNIYEEESYPVVAHRFYGKTLKEARGYFVAHMKSDKFLHDAVRTSKYKGMQVQVEIKEVS